MGKKSLTLLFASVLAIPLLTVLSAPNAQAEEKMAKEARWEGTVVRSNPDKSSLTVRKVGSPNDERTIMYDSSTKWVSQEHGSKTVNDIDVTQIKDGDRVIAKGTWDKGGMFHATLISKRLSH
jgi:hypothetical protein